MRLPATARREDSEMKSEFKRMISEAARLIAPDNFSPFILDYVKDGATHIDVLNLLDDFSDVLEWEYPNTALPCFRAV